jgi:hypothetical protein
VSGPIVPLVEALALAVTARESDLYWTAGAGNEGAIADGHKARLSAVLAAAREIVAVRRRWHEMPLADHEDALDAADRALEDALAAADAEVGP